MRYPILLVDDNKLISGMISKLLHSLGYDMSVAHSGREAMRMLKKIRPKIILLDIGMPVMNGYQLARHIRQNKKFSEIVLIAFSGRGRRDDKLKAREAGFDHFVKKSASISELRMILNTYDY